MLPKTRFSNAECRKNPEIRLVVRARAAASRQHYATWRPPRDDAVRPRPHFKRGQTGGDRLVASRAGIWGDADRRAVIGGTENDRL